MPELRIKEVRLPELRLPEMSRDDISRVIDDARDQIADLELPRLDLSMVELPRVDLPKVDLPKVDLPRAVAGVSFLGRRAPRRWPFVVGGVVAVTVLTAVVVSQPPVQARLRRMAGTARRRFDERRAEMEARGQGAHAFDAAVAVPVQPSAYADDAPLSASPFDGTDGLPDGLGMDQTELSPVEDAVEDATRV